MKYRQLIAYFTIGTILLYLPLLLSHQLLLSRGNDLEHVFWPVWNYVRVSLIENNVLPLWNTLFFAGTPLLADPQFSYFYPPNWLMVLLPTNIGFFVYFLLHSFFAGVFMYIAINSSGKYPKQISLMVALLYILNPQVSGYLEAGHYGLVATQTWIPLLVASIVNMYRKNNQPWVAYLAIGLSALFFTHTIIFLYATAILTLVSIALVFREKKFSNALFLKLALSALLVFGLTSATLLPQLSLNPLTTRSLLLSSPEIYPKWHSFKEVVRVSIFPWTGGLDSIRQIETEKWIPIGVTTTLVVAYGFLVLKRRKKVFVVAWSLGLLLILLNSLSPIYPLLVKLDFFVLSRVSTRPWFAMVILISFLLANALNSLLKKYGPKIVLILLICLLTEALFINWARLTKPVKQPIDPPTFINKIAKENELFRVFCTTRCIPQKVASTQNLQLVEGYNTLQLKNYFEASWGLMGGYWGYYTLSVPPFGAINFSEVSPNAKALGEWNTKYVVAKGGVGQGFQPVESENGFTLYQITEYLPRTYFTKGLQEAPIISYNPNKIELDVSKGTGDLRIAEVYSPGWIAYIDGKKAKIQETPNHLRQIDIPENSKTVSVLYRPKEFIVGLLFTLLTYSSLIIWFIKKKLTN